MIYCLNGFDTQFVSMVENDMARSLSPDDFEDYCMIKSNVEFKVEVVFIMSWVLFEWAPLAMRPVNSPI